METGNGQSVKTVEVGGQSIAEESLSSEESCQIDFGLITLNKLVESMYCLW